MYTKETTTNLSQDQGFW